MKKFINDGVAQLKDRGYIYFTGENNKEVLRVAKEISKKVPGSLINNWKTNFVMVGVPKNG